jgi:hypothetical protein
MESDGELVIEYIRVKTLFTQELQNFYFVNQTITRKLDDRRGVAFLDRYIRRLLRELDNQNLPLSNVIVTPTRTEFDNGPDEEAKNNATKIAVGATSVAGVVAVAGPATAMGLATAVGTAGTGAAISGLSGAAANAAALAWLGGGTIASGGGGMAGGTALLGMFGPIGLAIGVIGFSVGGIVLLANTMKTKTERRDYMRVSTADNVGRINRLRMMIGRGEEILRDIKRSVQEPQNEELLEVCLENLIRLRAEAL